MLIEAGVHYEHIRKLDELPKGMKAKQYVWEHLSTRRTGTGMIVVFQDSDFLKLLEHWNRTPTWKYYPKTGDSHDNDKDQDCS
jgi:hypothetical protein